LVSILWRVPVHSVRVLNRLSNLEREVGPERAAQRFRVSGSRPKLELSITDGRQLHEQMRLAVMHVQIPDHLSMATVEPFGQPQDGRQRFHSFSPGA
jgi:hypothetical protein